MVIDSFLVKCYCENMRSTARGSAVSGGIMRVSFFKRTIFVLIVVLSVITAFALAGCEDKDGCTHVWNDGEITTAATCTQDGVKTFTCTLCGETRTEVVGSSGHVFDREVADAKYLVSEATCIAKAVYYKSCVCGAKGTETFESGEYAAHTLVKTDRVEPTCIENGTEAYWTCSACGKLFSDENGTTEIGEPVAIPATGDHVYGADLTKDATGHWYECSVCGNKKDFAEHTLVGGHNADVHYDECSVCHARFNESAHEWDGGVVTKKPTLTTEGEKTYTCACGETKVEKLAAQASFADDFTLEEGQPGPWSYGSIDYEWGEQEDFTFTQATAKNGGGDGWEAEGVEIKGGWINASNMMAVAYTVDRDVTVKVNLTFTGGTADTRLSLRTGVKNADGVIYGNPAYFDGEKQSNVLNYETRLELKAGDTVYFILGNENGTNPAAYPNGELDIVLTQVIG